MPVPTLITDLSTTAAANYPSGTDTPAILDDVQRAHASFIALLRDQQFGQGQTYVDVSGSRTLAMNVTNSTGKPWFVLVRYASSTASTSALTVTVAGVALPNYVTLTTVITIAFVVGPGQTYRVDQAAGAPATLFGWMEYKS